MLQSGFPDLLSYVLLFRTTCTIAFAPLLVQLPLHVQPLQTSVRLPLRKVLQSIIMRTNINQPLAFDIDGRHEVVPRGHHELIVQHPLWFVIQAAAGMEENHLGGKQGERIKRGGREEMLMLFMRYRYSSSERSSNGLFFSFLLLILTWLSLTVK